MEKYVDKAVSWDRLGITFEQVRPFQKADNKRAFLHVFGFLGLLTLSALSVIFFALQGWWVAFALALYVHGGLLPFCDSAVHELNHNTMFTKKSYNLFFARLFSLLYWRVNYALFRASHSKHHAYTQMQISDGENIVPGLFTRKVLLLKLIPIDLPAFVSCSLRLLTLRPMLHMIGFKFTPWQKHVLSTAKIKVVHEIYQWAYITLLFHAIILIVAVLSGFWFLPLVLTLAPFYGAYWYPLLIGSTQHSGMGYNDNRFVEICRSIKLSPFSSFLYFHMEYHVEHHMFASIPCYNLREFRKAFQDKLPKRLPILKAIFDMLRTSKDLKVDMNLKETQTH